MPLPNVVRDCRNLVNRQRLHRWIRQFRRWPKIFLSSKSRALGLPQKLRFLRQKRAAFRKTVCQEGKMAFSRLMPPVQSGWCDFFSFREDIRKCAAYWPKFSAAGDSQALSGPANRRAGFCGLGKNEIFIFTGSGKSAIILENGKFGPSQSWFASRAFSVAD